MGLLDLFKKKKDSPGNITGEISVSQKNVSNPYVVKPYVPTTSKPTKQKLTIPKPKFQNKIEREMYEKNIEGYRDLKDSLDRQDALLKFVFNAEDRYNKDGDLNAVIEDLEYAFIESKSPCKAHCLDLVNYYCKAGQNDKAWGYLNLLYMERRIDPMFIRFEQAKILKKEKRWADAVEMYMLGYLAKCDRTNFKKELFIKDIKSSANKLGWDDSIMNSLAQILEKQIISKNFDESSLSRKYRKLYNVCCFFCLLCFCLFSVVPSLRFTRIRICAFRLHRTVGSKI